MEWYEEILNGQYQNNFSLSLQSMLWPTTLSFLPYQCFFLLALCTEIINVNLSETLILTGETRNISHGSLNDKDSLWEMCL